MIADYTVLEVSTPPTGFWSVTVAVPAFNGRYQVPFFPHRDPAQVRGEMEAKAIEIARRACAVDDRRAWA